MIHDPRVDIIIGDLLDCRWVILNNHRNAGWLKWHVCPHPVDTTFITEQQYNQKETRPHRSMIDVPMEYVCGKTEIVKLAHMHTLTIKHQIHVHHLTHLCLECKEIISKDPTKFNLRTDWIQKKWDIVNE